MPKPTSNQIINKSGVAGSTITDALETLRTAGSFGDMSKLVYDVNNNGKVDVAEVAEKVEWIDVDNKPFAFPPSAHPHPDATTSDSGFLSASDKSKLDGIVSGATANDTDANLKNRANHTGTQNISTVTNLQTTLDAKQATLVSGTNIKTINGNSVLGSGDLVISGGGGGGVTDHGALTGLADDDHTQYHTDARGDARYSLLGHTHSNATTSVAGFMSAADKTKLDGVAAGATANSSNATLLNRANHTGTQAQSTVTNLTTDLAAKQATLVSGTNIKTINGSSILGSGNLSIAGGAGLAFTEVTATSRSVAVNEDCYMTNAAATTLTAPATPNPGDRWGWAVCNGRVDNVINWNGAKHENNSDSTMTITAAYAAGQCVYVNATYGWKIL